MIIFTDTGYRKQSKNRLKQCLLDISYFPTSVSLGLLGGSVLRKGGEESLCLSS